MTYIAITLYLLGGMMALMFMAASQSSDKLNAPKKKSFAVIVIWPLYSLLASLGYIGMLANKYGKVGLK